VPDGAVLQPRTARARFTAVAASAVLLSSAALGLGQDAAAPGAASLDEVRLTMGKWIETQQIIAKERNEWQQGQEILRDRLELVKKEIASLEERIAEGQASVAKSDAAKQELLTEQSSLEATTTRLKDALSAMEQEIRRVHPSLPDPLRERLQALFQRMPEAGAEGRVSVAERFQNVLGILNELNKANMEIAVHYEVRTLADGTPSEVKALYVGLGQAYYVSARGEAGIGRPGAQGWEWEQAKSIGDDVTKTLEILQGKHSPEFVPLPVRIR
jgi:hypothetical protein